MKQGARHEAGIGDVQHGTRLGLRDDHCPLHGRGTAHPPAVVQMLAAADHPNVVACWNSNMTDLQEDGGIDEHFALLRERIDICHINTLWNDYPWTRLFALLQQSGFDGYCLAEIPASNDPETILRYYRALFQADLERAHHSNQD